jgi:hypothetical protein
MMTTDFSLEPIWAASVKVRVIHDLREDGYQQVLSFFVSRVAVWNRTTQILEEIFELLNVGSEMNPIVRSYRQAGNRSLSVGDVVVIDNVAFECRAAGWEGHKLP